MTSTRRALVTGVGRSIAIGASVAEALRVDGWDVVTCGWRGYDERMPWGADLDSIADIEADFTSADEPERVVQEAGAGGPLHALVLCHCESVDSSIADTSVEAWDRHFAVNARSNWLLIQHFAAQFAGPAGVGRVVAFTSDALAHNLPYGASKGALDRIIRGASIELAPLGITANAINPGATDTGWMDDEIERAVLQSNLQPRLGTAQDAANLVRFLVSDQGQWINGQLLYSNGGIT